jgi:hypothetical protein
MSNREKRIEQTSVHLLMAFARQSHGEKADCIRHVIKNDFEQELAMLKAKLEVLGGYWRIHRTVNARDVDKARKWLLHDLIEHPEHGAYVDSQWRTALLQTTSRATNFFMLDVDTKVPWHLSEIGQAIFDAKGEVVEQHESPKGWHFITKPFDTRNVCKLPNVTLIRDGYYFICEVGEKKCA